MRRIVVLFSVVLLVLGAVGPASAGAPESYREYSSSMQASFSEGPQQISFGVHESDDAMGYGFWISIDICDYEAPGGAECWTDTNQNFTVHSFGVTKKGGFFDADVEMRSVFDSQPNQTIRVTATFDFSDPQVTRSNQVVHDSDYGFYKVSSLRYSDESPEIDLVFSDLLVDMPFPSTLNYGNLSLNNAKYTIRN